MSQRKRYAIVGTGGRCVLFIDAICDAFKEHAELVAFCDVSPTRMAHHNRRIKERYNHEPVVTYVADDFDRMVAETKPDVVIVTTMDSLHHKYIIRAMELGCDAISEKPMTTDADKAKAIFDAIERTGRKLRVTFNYRYTPHATKFRELVRDGLIGKPQAVDFSWVLDTRHGADYFHRWHAQMQNSGGLLVHKSTHHFDLINWWIQGRPKTVYAMGDLKFYGRKNAAARGESYTYDRYTGHPEAEGDPFALFLDRDENAKSLYLDAEKDSGYIRDRNVFGDHINIYDTMAVLVNYDNGVILNYSLQAYSPWEGFRAAITGDKGRIELFDSHGSHIITGQDDKELAAAQHENQKQELVYYPMFGKPEIIEVQKAEGGHGGGDPIMLEQIFAPNPPEDPFHRAASHIDGATSILCGVCANQSIATGSPVYCDQVLPLPGC